MTPSNNYVAKCLFADQSCRLSRNIAQVTPKIIYFYYQKIHLQDQSMQKIKYFFFWKNLHRRWPLQWRFWLSWFKRSRRLMMHERSRWTTLQQRVSRAPLARDFGVGKQAALLFQPKYQLVHPENYLFLVSEIIFSGSKYPKCILFTFENKQRCCEDRCASANS